MDKAGLEKMNFDVEKAKRNEVFKAFIWSETPQGEDFWIPQNRALTDEGRQIIQSWIDIWEGKPKTLQLRIGGKYKSRDGRMVTITGNSPHKKWPWQGDDDCTFTDDGVQDEDIKNNQNNLIEEITTGRIMKTMSELDEMNVIALRTLARETFGGASWIASASRAELCEKLTAGEGEFEEIKNGTNNFEPPTKQIEAKRDASPLALAIEQAIKNTMGDQEKEDIKPLKKRIDWLEANFETLKEEKVIKSEVIIKRENHEDIGVGSQHFNFPTLLKLMQVNKNNIMLVGETGSGKSDGCMYAAKALNLQFFPMSICKQTTKADLMGYLNPFDGKIIKSALRHAFEDGGVCCLDEIDKGNDNVMAVLNSLSSNGGCMFPDGYIHRHKDFILVATANTHGTGGNRRYCGSNQLDASTIARYAVLAWDYDEMLELQISCNQKWTRRVQALRKAAVELESDLIISPRVSIMGGKMIDEQGFTFEETENIWIFSSVDSDTKMKIRNSAS